MIDPGTIYAILRPYFWLIVSLFLAMAGFIIRFRGDRRNSTVLIIIAYFIMYLFPLLWEKYKGF